MTLSSGPVAPPSASFTIRPASQADAAFLFSLAPRLAGVHQPPWHDLVAMGEFQHRYMVETFGNVPEGSLTLVAVSTENVPLGYIHAHPDRDGVTDEPCGYVSILAVEEKAEGLGVARQLMAQAEDWAREKGFRLLSLDVFADNGRALNFYRRGGFRAEMVRMVKPL
jgi:GNAT superfamily N-acetyltransferase